MTTTPSPTAGLPPLPDQVWRELFWQMARKLNCLPSTFPDANDHVFRAADRYIGLACKTCNGHGLVGGMTAEGGEGWECPDCHGSGALAAIASQGDAELLDWMISRGARVHWSEDHEVCNVWLPPDRDGTEERPAEGYPQKCYYDARVAIRAAITAKDAKL